MAEPSERTVTTRDIDLLVTGATPQFSMQILERVKALVDSLLADDPVRRYGELQLRVLERMAMGTTRGTRALAVPGVDNSGWASIPSHPRGGIAPGTAGDGH